MRQGAQQVQCVGVLGGLLQDAAVQDFGLGQSARAVVLPGQLETLGNRRRAGRSRKR